MPAPPAVPKRALWRENAIEAWRLVIAVVSGFRGESLALRAGNLTFITITSLVPLAAVVLLFVHAFDSEKQIERLVMVFFTDILSPGMRERSSATIQKYLSASDSRVASTFSFVLLMISSGMLLRHLDASLNEVWAIRRRRPVLISIALYVGVLLIGPFLMVLTLLGTETAKSFLIWVNVPFSNFAVTLGSLAMAIVLFSSLYKAAPHAHVPWRSALFGGAVAGLVWELARRLYGSIAGLFFNANPVYGSLGVAPLFLMWIYVSWFIVISGARLAYALEHADFHDEFRDLLEHPRSAEIIATRVATLVSESFSLDRPPPTVRSLASSMKLPAQRIADLVFQLEQAGLLIKRKGELLPGRSLSEMTLADISYAVGGTSLALNKERFSRTGLFEDVAALFTEIDEASVQKLNGISWAALAARNSKTQKP